MRSIGELARDSGLTVSALRFYDGAGVLVPTWVDPASGYRWYGPEQLAEARLLARLRRVRLPLADVRLVLAGWSNEDTSLVRGLLDAHLRRLEDGLADARRELSTVRALLATREIPVNSNATTAAATATRLTLPASDLATALDQVRFAVSTDPELPMLGGILLDADADADADADTDTDAPGTTPGTGSLRAVATDRYRMALSAAAPAVRTGPPVQAIVPAALADTMRALLGGHADASAGLTFDGDLITLELEGSQVSGQRLDFDFPDYRRLTRLPSGRRFPVDVPALRAQLLAGASLSQQREADGGVFELSLLSVAEDGSLSVVTRAEAASGTVVGVNRDFLLEALSVGGGDQLVLELGGPISPLAIRLPEPDTAFSLLMPVRLTEPPADADVPAVADSVRP